MTALLRSPRARKGAPRPAPLDLVAVTMYVAATTPNGPKVGTPVIVWQDRRRVEAREKAGT